MKTKFILVLVVINVLIFTAVVWHRHTHPSSSDTWVRSVPLDRNTVNGTLLAPLGISRDITAQEVEDATNILVQERRMWSQFNGMSGGIDVELDGSDGKHFSLEGNISLRRLDLSPMDKRMNLIAKHEMTLSDKRGGWKVKTDGTPKNTVITCQDPQMSETIKTIDPASILHMLTFPQYWLGTIYRDKLYPHAADPYTLDEMLTIFGPWLVTNAATHSYTFWDDRGAHPDFSFKNGHFYRFRRMELQPGNAVKEKLAVYFENPVESNGFWYPTVFRITPAPTPWPYPDMSKGMFVPLVPLAHAGQLRITLSNVSLSVK
jgi:hypothetical protein